MAILTAQSIFHQFLPSLLTQRSFTLHQYKALQALSRCRTAALGGHAQYCPNGHLNGVWYNSCKHRACPQCQGMASEQWLQNTQALLLNCSHHHVIFTLPDEVLDLWRYNRALMCDLLFKSAQQTLLEFSKNPKYLNAKPGILMALHTWGRSLNLHPHLHVLISHGGLSKGGQWVEPRKKHLFPQKPVMQMYKGKFLSLLRKELLKENCILPPTMSESQCRELLCVIRKKDWVVHFCKRYKYAGGVAKYLSRYVKRSPLKNSQIKMVSKTHVRFVFQSHQTHKRESMMLRGEDFISRLAEHIPLRKKPSVRYFGIYTPSLRRLLDSAKHLIGQSATSKPASLVWEDYLDQFGSRPVCSECGLALSHREVIPRQLWAA